MAGGRELVPRKIIFEGVDGCGKDSAAGELAKLLKEIGVNLVLSPEPDRSTPTGRLINDCLTQRIALDPIALQLLFMANRAEILAREKGEMEAGRWVIKPRSFLSTAAHVQGLEIDGVLAAHRAMLPGVEKFDVFYWLKIPVEVALNRLANSGKRQELFEKEEKMVKTTDRYGHLAELYGSRCVILDSEKNTPEQLAQIIFRDIKTRGWL